MYDYPPYRPPSEADSALIRVNRGCWWNHCTFCGMYKNIKFENRTLKEISKDVDEAGDFFPGSQTVFIGDSDSLVHDDILSIIKLVRKNLPEVKRITSYARAQTLVRKSVSELVKLREAGLTRLHVGLESGSRTILKRIRKGATPEIMIEAGLRTKEAGIELCFYVLSGLGGEDLWPEHARETAKVIEGANPDFVRLRTLSLVSNAPIFKQWQAGKFKAITPLSRIKETRSLINEFEKFNGILASDHLTNYLWSQQGIIFQGVGGKFPQDKEKILEILDQTIKEISDRDDIVDANTLVQLKVIDRL